MELTVGICTWNRSSLLADTLRSLAEVRGRDEIDWELLVVDNNCTDDTADVLDSFMHRLPLRRLHESRQGHAHARNCALQAARGELLVWTDDDVQVHTDWLVSYLKAAKSWPEASYFGGRIDPAYEAKPPDWVNRFQERFSGLLLIRDFGNVDRVLLPSELPFGANMAFRTNVLREYGFDTNLGKCGDQMILGEDIGIIKKLCSDGRFGVWVSQAKVDHFIPKHRLAAKYLWAYHVGVGRTDVRLNGSIAVLPSGRRVPRAWYKKFVTSLMMAYAYRAAKRPSWVIKYAAAARQWGAIYEARQLQSSRAIS